MIVDLSLNMGIRYEFEVTRDPQNPEIFVAVNKTLGMRVTSPDGAMGIGRAVEKILKDLMEKTLEEAGGTIFPDWKTSCRADAGMIPADPPLGK